MPMRGHDDRNRNCGLNFGWCLLVIGLATGIFTITYIVAPALRGTKYQETRCIVDAVDFGAENMFNCMCNGYCRARAPCVRIFVDVLASQSVEMAHASLTSLERFPMCSFDNRQCVAPTTQGNVHSATVFVHAHYHINTTLPCWTNGDDVVFDIDISMSDVVNSIVFPVVALFIGLCLVCVNSQSCRECGGLAIMIMVFPLWFMLYGGPRMLMQKVKRRWSGGNGPSSEGMVSFRQLNRGRTEPRVETLPLYTANPSMNANGPNVEFPPAYFDLEGDDGAVTATVVAAASIAYAVVPAAGIVDDFSEPEEDPPPYDPHLATLRPQTAEMAEDYFGSGDEATGTSSTKVQVAGTVIARGVAIFDDEVPQDPYPTVHQDSEEEV